MPRRSITAINVLVQDTDAHPLEHIISALPTEDRVLVQPRYQQPGLLPGPLTFPSAGLEPSDHLICPSPYLLNGFVPGQLAAYRYLTIQVEGSSPVSGTKVHEEGVMCGVTRCGTQKLTSVGWPRQFAQAVISYDEVAPRVDGNYAVHCYAKHDYAGWQ